MDEARKRSETFEYTDSGGSGPVVVFLHGVLMNGDVWDATVSRLQTDCRKIVVELPFGAHPAPMPPDADLSLGSLAKMIAAFIEELDLRDVTLICNDWGGAQLTVSPGGSDRIANLVLVSCEAFDNYPPGLPGRLLCMNAGLPGGTLMTARILGPKFLRNLPLLFGGLTKKGVPDDLFTSWLERLKGSKGNRRDLSKYLRNVPRKELLRRWAEEQKAFRGNVLIVWAREDKLMPPEHAELLAEHFQNTELIWVDDSRTLIPIDQPAVLAEHLDEFCRLARPERCRSVLGTWTSAGWIGRRRREAASHGVSIHDRSGARRGCGVALPRGFRRRRRPGRTSRRPLRRGGGAPVRTGTVGTRST